MGAIGYSNHDAMGRPKTVTLPGTRNVGLDYDKNGNVRKVTTPLAGGRDHFFSANALELLGTYTPPSSSPGGPTLYSWDRDKLVLLVTDGGDQESFPKTAAQRLRDKKVRVITLGLGRASSR